MALAHPPLNRYGAKRRGWWAEHDDRLSRSHLDLVGWRRPPHDRVHCTTGFTVVPCSAVLDVDRPVVDHPARLLAAHRHTIGTPRRPRALTPFRQVLLVLRHLRDGSRINAPARDHAASNPLWAAETEPASTADLTIH